MSRRFIAYHRVSTAKQGQSGLGLEAQKAAVLAYLNESHGVLLGEYTEVESGKNNKRPELAKALGQCKMTGATLVIAKLDRLSRNVAFLANLMDGAVDFVACDNPHATRFTLHILAAVAEHEAAMISQRTRAALAAAKERGVALGGYRGAPVPDHTAATAAKVAKADAHAAMLAPVLAELRDMSMHEMARELTRRGIVTARGGQWTATGVRRSMLRRTVIGSGTCQDRIDFRLPGATIAKAWRL